jgi:hypothetical protein
MEAAEVAEAPEARSNGPPLSVLGARATNTEQFTSCSCRLGILTGNGGPTAPARVGTRH